MNNKQSPDIIGQWEKNKDGRPPRGPNPNTYSDPAQKAQPGGMFNGMILPIAKLSIKGALFYQGENNSFTVGWKPYYKTLPSVIHDWRRAFGQKNLPFGIIQIAGWSNRRSMTYDMNHHTNVVREVQHDTWQRTPGTGLIVTFDLNSNSNIHPGHKRPVGDRAARWALAEVYGLPGHDKRPLRWRGPVFASAEAGDGKVVVRFEAGTADGLRLDKNQPLGFYLAGEDQVFHVATARVFDKTALEVRCEAVPAPVAVRYAWSNLPLGSLMNSKELPAYPFRSDAWPLHPHRSDGQYQRR